MAEQEQIVVLTSGGPESAVLVDMFVHSDVEFTVLPVYVRFGFHWERAEESHLREYLRAVQHPRLQPLTILEQPVADIPEYRTHWAFSGEQVPDRNSPDVAVELPFRNSLLLIKPMVLAAARGCEHLAIGTLEGNPFPDANPRFFCAFAGACGEGSGRRFTIHRLELRTKAEVLLRGQHLPLELTFSCINPVLTPNRGSVHCGRCNKCEERRRGFADAGLHDRTSYAATPVLC